MPPFPMLFASLAISTYHILIVITMSPLIIFLKPQVHDTAVCTLKKGLHTQVFIGNILYANVIKLERSNFLLKTEYRQA